MATVRALQLFPGGCIEEIIDPSFIWPAGFDEGYPIGTDLTTAMAMYWRVKEWTFFAGNRADGIGQDAIVISLENYNPETEKDLVCNKGGSFAVLGVPPYIDESEQEETIFVTMDIFWGGGYAGFYEDKIYPAIFPFFGLFKFDVDASAGQLDQFGFFLEAELNFKLPTERTAYRLEVTPKTFWPYDPGDGGGPIYDSATGEQLRAFPD
jgi:hypothetical protein